MFPPSSKSISACHMTLILRNAHDNSPESDCYQLPHLQPHTRLFPAISNYHRFYDVRSIPSTSDNDYALAPPLLTSSREQCTKPLTSAYLNRTRSSNHGWTFPATPISPLKHANSASTIYQYIAPNNTPGSNASTYVALCTRRPS
jgi:hypothetical protein